MKKKMMLLAFMFPIVIHGMELSMREKSQVAEKETFCPKLLIVKPGLLPININTQVYRDSRDKIQNCSFYRTKLKALQESIFNMDGKVDLIVVGENQQRIMRNRETSERMKYRKAQIVYLNNNGAVKQQTMESKILNIKEPKIRTDIQTSEIQDISSTYVRKQRILPECKNTKQLFFNDEAIQEALKDLELCYSSILNIGWVVIGEVQRRSIAIPVLSTEFGFTAEKVVAIIAKVVTQFVGKYPRLYTDIDLYTTEKSEIEEYERLMGPLLSKS